MSISHLQKWYAIALKEVAVYVHETLRTERKAVPTARFIAKFLTPSPEIATEHAHEVLVRAIQKALTVPSHPTISINFGVEASKTWPPGQVQDAIQKGANAGLKMVRRKQIVEVLRKVGVRPNTANELAHPIITAPERVREYTRIES